MFRTLCNWLLVVAVVSSSVLQADWPTFGGDPQRTGWNKSEDTISKENAKGIKLQWKIKLDNQDRQLTSLTPPVVMEGVLTQGGLKEYVIVGGASDTLFAIDADSGKLVWKKQFAVDNTKLPKQDVNWLCPNALNATPVVNHWEDKHLPNNTVFALASDGKMHSLKVNDGEDAIPPTQFTPPFSKNWSLNIHDGVIYTSVSQGCGGAKSGVYAMDFRTPDHKVTFTPATTSGGAGIWGRGGVSIGKDRVFASTGDGPYDADKGNYSDTVMGISLADGKLVDYYTPANRNYMTRKDLDIGNTTPAVFPYKDREIVAAAGKEGVIYLLDGAKLGGADHRTPLFRSPLYLNEGANLARNGFWGAFATWLDDTKTRWLFAPALGPLASQAPAFPVKNGDTPNGSILAFHVDDKDGSPVLTPVWTSRDMNVPEPPVTANGVVFVLSNGEFTGQVTDSGGLLSSAERIQRHTGNAVLYALDATTGKELYSSGTVIQSFTHFSGLALSSGHILVTTYDNTLYSFGL
jgi:hypothetical protein